LIFHEIALFKDILHKFYLIYEFYSSFYRVCSNLQKPIFCRPPYSLGMDLLLAHPEISLRFRIEDDSIGTLEGALATARRVGAELRNLRAGLGTHGLEVWMRLAAADTDALALCRTRLQNLVGVVDVTDIPQTTSLTAAVVSMRDLATLAI
jgi:hypothetical protein